MAPEALASGVNEAPSVPPPRPLEILPATPPAEEWQTEWFGVLPEVEQLARYLLLNAGVWHANSAFESCKPS
jgi:hypothetical protein